MKLALFSESNDAVMGSKYLGHRITLLSDQFIQILVNNIHLFLGSRLYEAIHYSEGKIQ